MAPAPDRQASLALCIMSVAVRSFLLSKENRHSPKLSESGRRGAVPGTFWLCSTLGWRGQGPEIRSLPQEGSAPAVAKSGAQGKYRAAVETLSEQQVAKGRVRQFHVASLCRLL